MGQTGNSGDKEGGMIAGIIDNFVAYEPKHEGVINDVWVRQEYEKYRSLRKTDVVVDAGAGFGAFTIKASLQARFVYAFEPEPDNFNLLKTNTERLLNVKIHQNALWSDSGGRPFYLSRDNWGGHSLFNDSDKNKTIQVKTVMLDEAVNDRVDFLKLDVEGSEIEVLKGAREILERDKPFIAAEIHTIPLFHGVKEYLSNFGYTLRYAIINSSLVEVIQPMYGTMYFD